MPAVSENPRAWVIVAAAGEGKRFGAGIPKQFVPVAGVPLLHRTLRAWRTCGVAGMVVVVPGDWAGDPAVLPPELRGEKDILVVAGGEQRTDSVRRGLGALPPDCGLVLIHDGARPAFTATLASRVLAGAVRDGACVPVLPAGETVKEVNGEGGVVRTLDRAMLRLVQTPQGFRREVLERAYCWLDERGGGRSFPDDAALVEASGQRVSTVAGEGGNLKVTTPADLARVGLLSPRVGFGYDVHRLVPGRSLWLGGVRIPFEFGLDGHSDADAALHALMDALLGAAGLPDIGQQFPNTDPKFRGASSLELLSQVVEIVRRAGFRLGSADLTIVAERPKLAGYLPAMVAAVSGVLGVDRGAVGVKATTSEGLGFAGRGEGIAAQAVAVLMPAFPDPGAGT